MRFKALLVAAAAAMLATPAFAAGYGEFTGNWRNEDSGTSDLTRLNVSLGGGGLRVRAWGQCHPTDCDWNTVDATGYGAPGSNPASSATEVIAIFDQGFARKILVLTDRPGDRLSYAVFTRFNDARRPYVVRGTMRKQAGGWPGWPPGGGGWPPGGGGGGGGWPPGGGGGGGLSFNEDCISFNWNQVQASFVGGEWKVVQGSMWMLSFGNKAAEAQRAAQIIRNYRFTEQCFIGRPNPSMTYWKRGNDVPSGGMPGDDCINNNPATTQARFVGGEWKIVDGSHWMLSFGNREQEARKAEEVIRNYNLGSQCYVGRPNPPMAYWLSQ